MSDVLSNDSGPESDFEFDDFNNEEGKNDALSAIAKIRSRAAASKKPATILKTSIKASNDPTKPPLVG